MIVAWLFSEKFNLRLDKKIRLNFHSLIVGLKADRWTYISPTTTSYLQYSATTIMLYYDQFGEF